MNAVPEFSRPLRIDTLGSTARQISLGANEAERAALANRFGVIEIERLSAEAAVTRSGDQVVATGEPVEESVDEAFRIEFRPQPAGPSEEDEIELSEGELDVVFYDGSSIDIGEAVAETFSLSLDPYPRSPDAEEALREAGVKSEGEAGAFGALAALRDKLKP